MRTWLAVPFIALALGACVDPTPRTCNNKGVCSNGEVCLNNLCVPEENSADAGASPRPDSGGGGGARPDSAAPGADIAISRDAGPPTDGPVAPDMAAAHDVGVGVDGPARPDARSPDDGAAPDALPPVDGHAPACAGAAQETRPCGLNDRGLSGRSCHAGSWGLWGNCVDPDDCSDGASEACAGETAGECDPGTRRCDAGHWLACENVIAAHPDLCDGLDNDCDGRVDRAEDGSLLQEACYSGPPETRGLGECADGVATCANGEFGACSGEKDPVAEVCDGRDNNCDGDVDNTPGDVGGACANGVGVCQREGAEVCQGGRLVCDAVGGAPRDELCNGLDDDCDGVVDNGLVDCTRCHGDASSPCNGCPVGTVVPSGWVCAPPGEFTMGSPAGLDPPAELGREAVEVEHQVTLTGAILVRATEVTHREWFDLVGTRPAYFANCGDDCPVEQVSWYDGAEYLNRLSSREGLDPCYALEHCEGLLGNGCPAGVAGCRGDRICDVPDVRAAPACTGYRFPTEAEWEYVARAGTRTAFSTGPIVHTGCGLGADLDANADLAGWYCGNSQVLYVGGINVGAPGNEGTHPVAGKRANDWGLSDVHGNVAEWAGDAWDGNAYDGGPVRDPVGLAFAVDRIGRGGAWNGEPQHDRSASRHAYGPETRQPFIGIRPVRSLH